MAKTDAKHAPDGALEDESLAWVNQLLSGAVTRDQAEAFQAWRARSPGHAEAFAEAMRFQRAMRRAIEEDRRDRTAPVAPPKAVPTPPRQAPLHRAPQRQAAPQLARRALLGGAIAASGTAYLLVQPPAKLWPSWSELTSDYHTGVGERRDLTVAQGVSLELNTRTSVARRVANGAPGIELVSGEAAVTARRGRQLPFIVTSGPGRMLLDDGEINVRADEGAVCVTCLRGAVLIEHPEGRLRLGAGSQATYHGDQLGAPTQVDPTVSSAWRKGLLIFRDAPLQQVVDELNRYRPGRIVLVDAALAHRPVYGVFQIREIPKAVRQVQDLTGAKATHLPGGLVLLS